MTESVEYTIAKLEPKPGDLVVVKFTRTLTREGYMRARMELDHLVPPGVKAMIVDHDVDVSVLTAEEIQRRAVTDDRSRNHSVSVDSE